MKLKPLIAVCLSLMVTPVFADDAMNGGDRPMGPPKELLDACQGKASGDACSFTGPNGNAHDGTCRQMPNGQSTVVCIPKPPKESLDACTGKNEGDVCSFMGKNNDNIAGKCAKTIDDAVACRPDQLPMGPEENGKK